MKKTPHIKVDAFPLVDSHFSGVGHYTLGIVQAFDEMAGEGKLTYSLIVPRRMAGGLAKYNFRHYKMILRNPVPNRIIRGFMKYHLPVPLDFVLGIGNYYFPSFLAWPTWFSKSTVVVHDITYVAVPECVDKGNREYLSKVMPFSLKNARRIIAVSKFSKSEIEKYYKLDGKNISVASPSVDRTHFYRRSEEEIRKAKLRYDIFDEKYILSVGNIEPRKNYVRLIDAYMALPKKYTDEYPLVLVGAGGWNNKEILEKIQEAKEKGYKVLNSGKFVRDEDMPALFSGAQFFVFTPIYEGFGMSPLEAYACGTPVIASSITAVPEAAGDAAIYVDPYDVQDITKKMEQMFVATEENREQFHDAIEKHLDSLNWRKNAEISAAAITGLPVEHFGKTKV